MDIAVLTLVTVAAATLSAMAPASAGETEFTRVPSPNPSDTTNTLAGVYAAAPDAVWMVGDTGYTDALIERWNGRVIEVVPAAPTPGRSASLRAVDGTGRDDVWAVGSAAADTSGIGTDTLVQHWNGTAWSRVPSPNLGADRDATRLFDVEAIARDNVWAIGGHTAADTTTSTPVVIHWDGTEWRVVPTGCRSAHSIAARTATDIWIAGRTMCHFDGSTWTVHDLGMVGPTRIPSLTDIAMVGPAGAIAVGLYTAPCPPRACYGSEVATWDGTRWQSTIASNEERLVSVHPLSPNDIWAVGSTGVRHYDGSTWTTVAGTGGANGDITVDQTGTVWAVGPTYGIKTTVLRRPR
ncbi:hypothetical protein [Herbihabitans rhizosphaerae]|nr:hypothetical protein [Herbihabitans rhizosphaerae]